MFKKKSEGEICKYKRVTLFLTTALLCATLLSAPFSIAYGLGIYGVHGNPPELSTYKINKVWGAANKEWIALQTQEKREVYLTLNAFGGTSGWQISSSAIPVQADGSPVSGQYGGMCPTDEKWQQHQLILLQRWLTEFSGKGKGGISGIWLDFLRYPGRWEKFDPILPDTCYCPRCMAYFQKEGKVKLPKNFATFKHKAKWINENVPLEWSAWKKAQIVGFTKKVRKIIDKYHNDAVAAAKKNWISNGTQRIHPDKIQKVKLGVFLVPWRKSDYNGAISFSLAQDAELLAPYVDVFSPMVYHQMVGQPVSWVGDTVHYFRSIAEKYNIEVWPIIQAEWVGSKEFGFAAKAAADNGAEDLLVYSLKHMKNNLWHSLLAFTPQKNLLPTLDKNNKATLPQCNPDKEYLFSAELLRPDINDSDAYGEISLWGKSYLLNTHRTTGKYQLVKREVRCPRKNNDKIEDLQFSFFNHYPDTPITIRNPRLIQCSAPHCQGSYKPETFAIPSFFPLGIYGGNEENLKYIKELGLNSAILPLNTKNIKACLTNNLNCMFSVPHQPERLHITLRENLALLRKRNFLFYIDDEPELRSVSPWKLEESHRIVKQYLPKATTAVAIVRPQSVPFYSGGADYFMMDQYPVPSMPFSWLSNSLDEAAGLVGDHRLMSVIQAFGGGKFSHSGWTRLPTFDEMYNLAILSVIHNSRGVFFYTFPEITKTRESREDFTRVITRINSLHSWLNIKNQHVHVTMLSHNAVTPDNGAAVHCTRKQQNKTNLLLCANILPCSTRAKIEIEGNKNFADYFSEKIYSVENGSLEMNFKGFEVKALLEK